MTSDEQQQVPYTVYFNQKSSKSSGVRKLKLRKWKVKETKQDSHEPRNVEEFSIWLAIDAGLPDYKCFPHLILEILYNLLFNFHG